jgi:hypothetical protein
MENEGEHGTYICNLENNRSCTVGKSNEMLRK